GLAYLTLDRRADTLSGGEAQRIRLAAQLGSNLRGVCYILDEPTIGLHPRDNAMLLDTLECLRARGNTVLVGEHDEATIPPSAAGPRARTAGPRAPSSWRARSRSTRARSAGRRARRPPPTWVSSTTSAGSSRRCPRRGCGAGAPAASRSTSRAAAARPARARGGCAFR